LTKQIDAAAGLALYRAANEYPDLDFRDIKMRFLSFWTLARVTMQTKDVERLRSAYSLTLKEANRRDTYRHDYINSLVLHDHVLDVYKATLESLVRVKHAEYN